MKIAAYIQRKYAKEAYKFDENVSRNDQTGKKRWLEIFDNVGFQNKKVTKQNKKR